jgi:hypothetical protein
MGKCVDFSAAESRSASGAGIPLFLVTGPAYPPDRVLHAHKRTLPIRAASGFQKFPEEISYLICPFRGGQYKFKSALILLPFLHSDSHDTADWSLLSITKPSVRGQVHGQMVLNVTGHDVERENIPGVKACLPKLTSAFL